jgi:hypothetical protein
MPNIRPITRGIDTGNYTAPTRSLGAGGNASGARALPTRGTAEELAPVGGQPLALPFGKHRFDGGQMIFRKYATGNSRFATALGDGGEKGWNAITAAYYAGQALSVSPDSTTAGYRFHPGTLSTGLADSVQGRDAFFTDALTYSGTAYAAVLLPAEYATEDTPYKFSCVAECALVPDYDQTGNLTGWSYSTNPARIAAYGIFVDTAVRLASLGVVPTDAVFPLYLQRRVDWTSWWRLRNICDETISWNDGTSTRDIKRFECNIIFTQSVKLDQFLDAVLATCASYWQDDAGLIKFVTPFDVTPVHHFSDGTDGLRCNVFSDYGLEPADLNTKLRNVVATFGDADTDLLDESQVQWRDERLIQRFGESPAAVRRFPNMNGSQAQRLLERQMRLETQFTGILRLTGHGDSMHVLKGDRVTVTNARAKWLNELCLVLSVDNENAERTPDKNTFTVQKLDGDLYRDDWHRPMQRAIAPA